MKKEKQKLFLKLAEVEGLYGIPAETIRKWINRPKKSGLPKLQAFKPGREILISREDLELYIKKFPAAS